MADSVLKVMYVETFVVKSEKHERSYDASKPDVAVKKFLNYLRLHREERPTILLVKGEKETWLAEAEWYTGKFEDGVMACGAEGEWWKFKGLRRMQWLEKLIWKKCQENSSLKEFGYVTAEDPFMELDYKLSCLWCSTVEELKEAFLQYDAFRSCLIYKDLVFVNQVNGGWEAWTLKRFGDRLIGFESITMQLIIKEGTHDGLSFEQYVKKLQSLTQRQVEHYLENCEFGVPQSKACEDDACQNCDYRKVQGDDVICVWCPNCGSKMRAPTVEEVGFGVVDLLCPVCGGTAVEEGASEES